MTERIPRDSAGYSQKQKSEEDPREIFIKNLTRKKEEIEKVIKELKEKHKLYRENLIADHMSEELDRADDEIFSQQYYNFFERKCSELKNIEKCINRILKNEEFGCCEECGERIGQARLSIMPDATRCVECQDEYEKRGSQKGVLIRSRQRASGSMNWDKEDTDNFRSLTNFQGNLDGQSLALEELEELDLVEVPLS